MRRLPVGLLAVAIAALVAALPAAGKEGARATLTTPVPLEAAPGTPLHVGWTLSFLDHGQRKPFGAGGVFVRLLSASGAGAETGEARERGTGEYAATVVVPKGGVGDVLIGIRSTVSDPSGTRQADWLLPITNDPMPGPARITAERSTGMSHAWIVAVVVAGSLLAIGLVGVAVTRRRRVLPV